MYFPTFSLQNPAVNLTGGKKEYRLSELSGPEQEEGEQAWAGSNHNKQTFNIGKDSA